MRSVAAGFAALVALLSTCVLATSAAHAERGSSGACGSYTEAGAHNGAENKRIAVVNRRVPCGSAITIVREFRSFLGKRHHGPAGDAGWWTSRRIRAGSATGRAKAGSVPEAAVGPTTA